MVGKTFKDWIKEHKKAERIFHIAWNRIRSRQNEKSRWTWDTIINRVKDYIIGLAACRYNPVHNCIEVDELFSINQPHIKKGEPIRILINEVFSRARDYCGSIQVIFTKDQREDKKGKIPEDLRRTKEKRESRPIPKELIDFAKEYEITFNKKNKGIISHKEGSDLWFSTLKLPFEVKEKIYELEEAGYLSKEIIAELISKGIWSKKELIWIFLNSPRPEALILGTDLPEDRIYYSESLNYARASLLATRFQQAIIAELTEGLSVEEIEKKDIKCVLEPKKAFFILRCNKNFTIPLGWTIDNNKKKAKAGEPILLLCRPYFPVSPEYDRNWIKKNLALLLNSEIKINTRCLLLSNEFLSSDYNKDINYLKKFERKYQKKALSILFAPSNMYLFLDEEIQKRMKVSRQLKHFPQRKGPVSVQIIEVPNEWWNVPSDLSIQRGLQNASRSAKIFAEQIVQNRDINHYRIEFTLACETLEREALQNHKIVDEIEGKESEILSEIMKSKDEIYKGVTFPYVRPEEIPAFLEKIRSYTNNHTYTKKLRKKLNSVLMKIHGGIVVVVKPWKSRSIPIKKATERELSTESFKLPEELKGKIDYEIQMRKKNKKYMSNWKEIDEAHTQIRKSLENRIPLSMASIRSHVFIEVIRDYVYSNSKVQPSRLKIAYSDGTEGESFPLFSLPTIQKPNTKLFPYPVGLVSLRHMEVDKNIERSLIRNREIQLKETSFDQEDLAFRRTYEHIEEFLKFLRGEIKENRLSLGLRAFLMRGYKLKQEKWEGLQLYLFHSTGLRPAVVGACRALIRLLKNEDYRGQLIIIPKIKSGRGYYEADKWY